MIEAGEPLGTRYVVVKTVTEPRAGALFEVADHAGMQFHGQLLSATAVAPALAAAVRQAVVGLPALPSVLKARDVALTSHALPVALLERPGGTTLASDRLVEIIEALGKREATVWLFRQIAAIANDLAQIHQSGATHGAISAQCVVCAALGDAGNLQLSGFGIDAFARGNNPENAPSKRADLVALLNALQELFSVGGLSPEGGAAAKWLLLRTSAQHGEHPALASGASLATALNEMAALRPDDGPPRVVRAPTLAPPTRSTAGSRQSNAPSASRRPEGGARKTDPPGRRGDAGSASIKPPAVADSEPPARPKVHLGVVVPGILLITAVVAAGVWYALHAANDVSLAHMQEPARRLSVTPAATCQGETPEHPEGVADFQASAEFDTLCLPSPDRIAWVVRNRNSVELVTRPAQRGGHASEARVIGQGAVELSSSLVRGSTLWISWRNGVGDPFGLARVEGDRVATVSVPLQGWDSVPLKGAWLLDVNARGAWIATSVLHEGVEHAVLLQVTFGPAAPDVVAWLAGPGVVYSVIPGETPALLLGRKLPGDAPRHEFTDVTLNLSAITAARRPADPSSVRGAQIPDAAVTRSQTLVVDSPAIGAARRGVVSGATHAWLVARGGVVPTETCQVPERCHSPGPVTVFAFPSGAAPTMTQVAPAGWAVDIAPAPGGALTVVATSANVAGAPVPFHTVYTLASPTSPPTSEHRNISTGRSPRARLFSCGSDTWVTYDATSPSTSLSALPLQCVTTP